LKPAKLPTPPVFLLGPGGKAITGEVLMVDGGFHVTGI
jgi:enoyl-[acyl-carrier-protein] reductase (NADH)